VSFSVFATVLGGPIVYEIPTFLKQKKVLQKEHIHSHHWQALLKLPLSCNTHTLRHSKMSKFFIICY